MIGRERYDNALTFEQYLPTVQKYPDLWAAVYAHAEMPDDIVQRVRALEGQWHLLVLSEDWCGDAVNIVPLVAKLAEVADNVDVRIFGRDGNPDIMSAHLTGGARSIPV